MSKPFENGMGSYLEWFTCVLCSSRGGLADPHRTLQPRGMNLSPDKSPTPCSDVSLIPDPTPV